MIMDDDDDLRIRKLIDYICEKVTKINRTLKSK